MKTKRETPIFLSEKMCKLFLENFVSEKKKITILEPSCGEGNLVNVISKEINPSSIISIELNKFLYNSCVSKNIKNNTTINGDFLHVFETLKNKNIDGIIMCPPFKNNIHLSHLTEIINYLKDKKNTVLVSLIHNGFWIDNSEICVNFRNLISKEYFNTNFIPLEDNIFKEKNKSIPCSIMVLKNN